MSSVASRTLRPWVVLDTETTGLDAAAERIIEVAAVTLNPHTLAYVDHRQWLLNPGRDTGPAHVHGISNEMVAESPSFESIASDLAEYLNGKILVAHNRRFDESFLASEFARAGVEIDLGRGFCTYRDGVMSSLAKARENINYPAEGAHRALNDVNATVEVFRWIWEHPDQAVASRASAARRSVKPVKARGYDFSFTQSELIGAGGSGSIWSTFLQTSKFKELFGNFIHPNRDDRN